jgi:urea transporter
VNNIKAAVIPFLKAIPHSYSTILFSDSLYLGIALMLVTMLVPIVGISGLFGLLCALIFVKVLGFESTDSSSGVLGFNSLLVSLAIGYFFPLSKLSNQWYVLAGMIVIASLATILLYIMINYWTQSRLKMPSMSLAFCITTTVVWYYMVHAGLFSGYGFEKPLLFHWDPNIPSFWKDFFRSMGSIMFVPDVIAGVIVTLVLICTSRIGIFLALIGWGLCWVLLGIANISYTYGMFFPGFNLILISMAVGSIYLIPGKASYLTAMLAVIIGFTLSYALSARYFYPDYMPARGTILPVPMFAFPMNITVIAIVFSLRLRLFPKKPVINEIGILHPEKALEAYLSRFKRFTPEGIPQLLMPVSGTWTVTQGHNGKHTHQKEWANAWDLEILDDNENKCSEDIDDLKNYFSYGKTVLASASGYVAKVVNGINDNPIGITNTRDNWGNYITINHCPGFYTLYAHLKEGSIKHAEGDYIKLGEKIGQVGNSGRSPYPHLHFQAQIGAEAGTRSVFCHMLNYRIKEKGNDIFVSSGVPEEGEQISPLITEKELSNILQLGYHQKQTFAVRIGNDMLEEIWDVELDLLGVHKIVSSAGTELEFSIHNGIFNALELYGRRRSALGAFGIGASRIPWAEHSSMRWDDEPGLSVLLSTFWKNLALFMIPFFKPIRLTSNSRISSERKSIVLESETSLRAFGLFLKKNNAVIKLSRKAGIEQITLSQKGKDLLVAVKKDIGETTDD